MLRPCDPGKLYMVAHVAGFNSHWAGHQWVDGVAGPLMADEAMRVLALGGSVPFEAREGWRVEWRPAVDHMEPHYIHPEEHRELPVAPEAEEELVVATAATAPPKRRPGRPRKATS